MLRINLRIPIQISNCLIGPAIEFLLEKRKRRETVWQFQNQMANNEK